MNNAERIRVDLIESIGVQISNLQAISNLVYALGEYSKAFEIKDNVLCYVSELIAQVSVELGELEKLVEEFASLA